MTTWKARDEVDDDRVPVCAVGRSSAPTAGTTATVRFSARLLCAPWQGARPHQVGNLAGKLSLQPRPLRPSHARWRSTRPTAPCEHLARPVGGRLAPGERAPYPAARLHREVDRVIRGARDRERGWPEEGDTAPEVVAEVEVEPADGRGRELAGLAVGHPGEGRREPREPGQRRRGHPERCARRARGAIRPPGQVRQQDGHDHDRVLPEVEREGTRRACPSISSVAVNRRARRRSASMSKS